jgi:hypothetical protein
MKTIEIDNNLLAAHICDNSDFEQACLSGNAKQIIIIVKHEMEEHRLFTPGAKKLYDDILRMTKAKDTISVHTGTSILSFVWNSRLSGTGLAVTY